MDLRLERAGKLLSNFLEDDLSGSYLGLGFLTLLLCWYTLLLATAFVGKGQRVVPSVDLSVNVFRLSQPL